MSWKKWGVLYSFWLYISSLLLFIVSKEETQAFELLVTTRLPKYSYMEPSITVKHDNCNIVLLQGLYSTVTLIHFDVLPRTNSADSYNSKLQRQ